MHTIDRCDLTLGILAGGRASRLGGLDKAWLQRGGVAQLVRLRDGFGPQVATILCSTNRDVDRCAAEGVVAIADRMEGRGPVGGLDALSQACRTDWVFTLPVDVLDLDARVLHALMTNRRHDGAWASDDDGVQPLVALWRVAALREATAVALGQGHASVQALQAAMAMAAVRFDGLRFGNLNTPEDLADAGIVVE